MESQRHAGGSGERRPWDVLLLVANVLIVIVGVAIVWTKMRERAGLGERETPPLDTNVVPTAPRPGAPDPSVEAPGEGVPGSSGTETRDAAEDESATASATEPDPVPGDAEEAAVVAHEPDDVPVDRPSRLRGQVDDVPPVPARLDPPPPQPRDSLHALAGTEALIDRIGVDVELLHAIRGAYPSSSAAFGANGGIKALHAALAKVGKTVSLRLGDTDDDGRMEILDAWGRPLVYFSLDDYDSAQRWVPGDAAAVDLVACRATTTHTHEASASYQLWSVGPDGRPGGGRGDDVTSWVRRD
jgi:hypothetical protein